MGSSHTDPRGEAKAGTEWMYVIHKDDQVFVDRSGHLFFMTKFCSACCPTATLSTSASESDSGTPEGRNLVVCIDGTMNQFSVRNTNVIELYSHLTNNGGQLTYYNSGIGTYPGNDGAVMRTLKGAIRWTEAMTARKISKIVLRAYRWLSENYQNKKNDRIYLFGFSRGAYAVRILAAMIHKVGLIHKGNEEQIPFAYAIYKDPTTEAVPTGASWNIFTNKDRKGSKQPMAKIFKDTFSSNASVHFVGVWDTVSSIGLVRRNAHPGTNNPHTACFFRHALALDERRVKYLPEYACGGESQAPGPDWKQPGERVKEVWFSGTHSDIGGGNVPNLSLDNGPAPLVWMVMEAKAQGVEFDSTALEKWNTVGPVAKSLGLIHESLRSFWRIIEYIPIKQYSYAGRDSLTRQLHRGRGRPMLSGQRVHISVALFYHDRLPRATLPESSVLCWTELVSNVEPPLQSDAWESLFDIDTFAAKFLVREIDQHGDDLDRCLKLLTTMTRLNTGLEQFQNDPASVLSLYRTMVEWQNKTQAEGQGIIQRALDRIGSVNGVTLDRPDVMSDMKEKIAELKCSKQGFETVVFFLHKHNLMRASFARMICDEILEWVPLGSTTFFDRETRCMSIKILIMAAAGGDGLLRCRIAQNISDCMVDLLRDSAMWGESFDAVSELLKELTLHADSRTIVFQNVPSLLQLFKDVTSPDEGAPTEISEHCIRVFGALSAFEKGGTWLIEEGGRALAYTEMHIVEEGSVFINLVGLLEYLLKVLEYGSVELALLCFEFFEKLLAFENTAGFITDDDFLATLFSKILVRDEAVTMERLAAFIEEIVIVSMYDIDESPQLESFTFSLYSALARGGKKGSRMSI